MVSGKGIAFSSVGAGAESQRLMKSSEEHTREWFGYFADRVFNN
jgi:hypothetical protein